MGKSCRFLLLPLGAHKKILAYDEKNRHYLCDDAETIQKIPRKGARLHAYAHQEMAKKKRSYVQKELNNNGQ